MSHPMFDYPMAIATSRDVAAVRSALGPLVEGAAAELGVPSGVLSASVSELTSPVSAEIYSELLGVPATARVTFYVDNKATDRDDYVTAYPALGLAAIRLSEAIDAEACLTFQLDRIVMRRREGRIELLDWWSWWDAAEAAGRLPAGAVRTSEGGRL